MDFFLFLIVNFILFVRPGDINPDWAWIPFYEVSMLATTAFAFVSVLRQFLPPLVFQRPMLLLLLGMAFIGGVSGTITTDLYTGRLAVFEVGKVILYFVLLVAVVRTPARAKWFLLYLLLCITFITVLAMLQYHELINIPTLAALAQGEWNPETFQKELTYRMRSTGIYNDPNDLSLVISVGIIISLWAWENRGAGWARHLWWIIIGVLVYGLYLTKSRGGIFGFAAGMLACMYVRHGKKFAIRLAILGIFPLVAAVFLSRQQTSLDLTNVDDSAQSRIILWGDGLMMLRSSPLWGVGFRNFVEEAGQVAHNSYLHMFAELGFLGGFCYLGVFYTSLAGMWRLHTRPELKAQRAPADWTPEEKERLWPQWMGYYPEYRAAYFFQLPPQVQAEVEQQWETVYGKQPPSTPAARELVRLYPYLLGLVAAYVVGMFSLSRAYVAPTYIFPALATAFFAMLPICNVPYSEIQKAMPTLNFRVLRQIGVLSVLFIVGMMIFVRMFAMYGVTGH
jgi:O-antigen ligase